MLSYRSLLHFSLLPLLTLPALCLAVPAVNPSSENVSATRIDAQREAFKEAKQAILEGDFATADALQQGILEGYPLTLWLDYYRLSEEPDVSKFDAAMDFIRSGKQQVLGQRLADKYLNVMGDAHDYQAVLTLMPELPCDPQGALSSAQKSKVCRFYEAKWALGEGTEAAVAFASNLYLSLRARPQACTGLIALYESNGYLTDKTRLEKFERAYIEPRYGNTVKSLSRELENSVYASQVKLAMELYEDPALWSSLDVSRPEAHKAAVLAFRRLARLNSREAQVLLDSFFARVNPSEVEKIGIYQTLGTQNLGRLRSLEDVTWVDEHLPAVAWNESLKEQRLRRAVYFGQWEIVYKLLDHVRPALASEINWRYWKGRSALELGYKDEGRAVLKEVAKDRSFFGFLAAQSLGQQYAFNHLKLASDLPWPSTVASDPAVRRFFELWSMDDPNAIYEWREIAMHSTENVALMMAEWALRNGNVRYAIDSVVASKRWDALDYRFPVVYTEIYEKNARAQKVPVSFLYAISRQESMLNPVIRSPVGAVGLMQLMPGTAKMVSRQNRWQYGGTRSLTQPEVNVRLGSAYIRDMLDKFGNNRILAAAAYNAGPGRIAVWKSRDGMARDAAMYVESIPFTETRKYVQNVLLYDVIYNKLLHGTQSDLLTAAELSYRY